ncbi:MAG: AAA family ATPase [Moraxella sp.]|nr:AAA family ATPase [Moraxella sp.]
MLSPELENTRLVIEAFAKNEGHEMLLTEHLLLGLLDNDSAKQVLIGLNASIDVLRGQLMLYLKDYAPKVQATTPANAPLIISKPYERTIRRAIYHVQASGRADNFVEGSDVLVALLNERDSHAVHLLEAQELTRLQILRYLSHAKKDNSSEKDHEDNDDSKPKKIRIDPLVAYAQNLNERAKKGLTDPLVGRNDEIERSAQILIRRRKNNPLLVGDPGVGKTAIAEGLAWLIVNNKVPNALKNSVIYSLDIGALVAGTKFRGDFEGRMKELLEALKKQPHAILFIDEIHVVVGAGSSMNSSMDMSNLIKPALANGELRCIGSTTFAEYRQIFEKDSALSRRFQKIDITEPSIDDTIKILQGLRSQYESFHRVNYTDEALAAAVNLSAKHIHDRFLPDKAIDVIDEAGASQNIHRQKAAKQTTSNVSIGTHANDTHADKQTNEQIDDDIITIDIDVIETVVAKIARIPPKSVSKDDKTALQYLERDLKQMVFGQEPAIKTLSDAIKLSRAGLKPAEKPIGAFMFAGPTGVGKTEISRQLAYILGIPLIRFDMSEYMETHTASRLIGAPPGYVGYDQGGLLTEKIHQNPYCVLLLDEIEKAHPDVFNLLLQVMDHGTLTDNNGRSTSFKQVILIMTTNVGADSMGRNSMGFTEQDNSTDNLDAMKRVFTPEFRNRLDAIVQFAPLDPSVIGSVVDKFLIELQAVLDDKKIVLTVSDDAREYLANKGYDKLMGARPMARLIQDMLKKPLAEMMLFGDLVNGGNVLASLENNAITLQITEKAADPA